MTLIKYRLEQWGNTAVFQVLEQDERITCRPSSGAILSHKAFNEVTVRSHLRPQLSELGVFIRGVQTGDDHYVDRRSFESANDCTDYITKVRVAIREYCQAQADKLGLLKPAAGVKVLTPGDLTAIYGDGKTIISYRLTTFHNALAFQVLQQDSREDKFGDAERFVARVDRVPELSEDEVYLRGRLKDYDLVVESLNFKTNTERDEYAQKVHAAIREWAEAVAPSRLTSAIVETQDPPGTFSVNVMTLP